jgi:hypothetical protein
VEIAAKSEDWGDFSNVRTLSSLFSNRSMRLNTQLVGELIQIERDFLDYIAFGSLRLRTVGPCASQFNCKRTHLMCIRNPLYH